MSGSNYPAALDNSTSMPDPNANTDTVVGDHAGLHDTTNQAVKALEAKVGVTDSTVAASHENRLNAIHFSVKKFGATGDGVTDDTTAIQAAFTAAAATATGATVYFPPGTYYSGKIIWKGKTNILGSGMGRSIVKAKNALNDDLFITENWASEHNINYNGYTTMERNFCRDISLWGNRDNQTIQGVQSDKSTYHYLIKYYGWLPVFEDVEFDNCEAALYTEYSNNQPHDPFENYELFEGRFAGLRGKNYARMGWCFRGPHDSDVSDIKFSGGDYDTPDYHILADTNGNYGAQGSYLFDVHTWGNTSTSGYDFATYVALNGFIYTEGSTNVCCLIQGGSNNLTILVGFQDSDNNTSNDAAVIISAPTSYTVSNNTIKVIAYYGAVNADLVRVTNTGGTMEANNIEASINVGASVTGSMYKLIGALTKSRFVTRGGQATVASFDTDSYSGTNNYFEAQQYTGTMFTTVGNVGKSDQLNVRVDAATEATRKSTYRWPVADRSPGFVSTGSDQYVDADSLQVRNVLDPTSAQHAATKAYVDLKGYSMQLWIGVTGPLDATTYMNGFGFSSVTSASENFSRLYIPAAGTITKIQLWVVASGTVGTTETSTVALRLNNTTNTNISTAVVTSTTGTNALYTLTLSQAVVVGDFIALQWVSPTWATNPGTVYMNAVVFVSG